MRKTSMHDAIIGHRMSSLARSARLSWRAGLGGALAAAILAGCATSTDPQDGGDRARAILEEEGKEPEVAVTAQPRLPRLQPGVALRQGQKLSHFAPASW